MRISKANTAKITLEATTLIITIYYSDELLEDSVIAMAEYVMGEITDAYENFYSSDYPQR